jgi:hypothetical protein
MTFPQDRISSGDAASVRRLLCWFGRRSPGRTLLALSEKSRHNSSYFYKSENMIFFFAALDLETSKAMG